MAIGAGGASVREPTNRGVAQHCWEAEGDGDGTSWHAARTRLVRGLTKEEKEEKEGGTQVVQGWQKGGG